MKSLVSFLILVCIPIISSAQHPSQIIRGKIVDADNQFPLEEVTIVLSGTQPFQTITDSKGTYKQTLPVGRYKMIISLSGYRTQIYEVLVISGRETIMDIQLVQDVHELKTVEISSSSLFNAPSAISLSIEKTLRVPANFFDPVRVITSYPGVVTTNDQNNSIIVRGNSPNGLLWRLNGVDIVNPNHLANAGTLSDRPAANGGGVNILSAQMLDRTNFFLGAFPTQYGNALSGIVDMSLRDGNRNKQEYTVQASLIGLDFSAEGPLNNKKSSSFLANYRYSTVGLLGAMGIDFGGESITFQDFSFNVINNTRNGGKISFFGLGGLSSNKFNSKPSEEWEEDKDRYNIDFSSLTYAIGLMHTQPLKNGIFKTSIAYSGNEQSREAVMNQVPTLPGSPYLQQDVFENQTSLLSAHLSLQQSLSENTQVDVGVIANSSQNKIYSLRDRECITCTSPDDETLQGEMNALLFQPYVESTLLVGNALEIHSGLRYVHFTYNDSHAIEPRLSVQWKQGEASSVVAAYRLTSQLQSTQTYITTGNENLDFTRAHQLDLNYRRVIQDNLTIVAGGFYQSMFDIPVESVSSTFSIINSLEESAPGHLVNTGTAVNKGLDLTLEKFFFGSNYMMFSGSVYDSKYKGSDGVERDSRFNGKFTLSGVYGKEWIKEEKNRTTGLNFRVLYLGGMRQSSIDSYHIGETFYNQSDPFDSRLKDYMRVDIRLSFRRDRDKYTRIFAVDLQNMLNQENEAYRYYDFVQGKVVTKFQLGIIPVIVYRIDF